jgi:hypothetical protein
MEHSPSYHFKLTANQGSLTTVSVGDEITISVNLDRSDQGKTGTYTMYSMQNEIIYDSTYFSPVEGSESLVQGYEFNTATMDDGIGKRVILSKMSSSSEGEETPDSQTVATFKLKALKAGKDLPIWCKDHKVNSKVGQIYDSTANQIAVTISGSSKPPVSPGGGAPGGNTPGEEAPGGSTPGENGSVVGGIGSGEEIAPSELATAPRIHICPSEPYIDVNQSLWFYEAVDRVLEKGLFVGTSDTTFEPNRTMNRAMIVTVLWRLEGKPVVPKNDIFRDVTKDSWYADAVSWANANQVVAGYGNGLFGPNDPITREQMISILHRYAQFKGIGISLEDGEDLTEFTDLGQVSSWALPGMKWAVANGIIKGITQTTLEPNESATRAQVAAVFMRL